MRVRVRVSSRNGNGLAGVVRLDYLGAIGRDCLVTGFIIITITTIIISVFIFVFFSFLIGGMVRGTLYRDCGCTCELYTRVFWFGG